MKRFVLFLGLLWLLPQVGHSRQNLSADFRAAQQATDQGLYSQAIEYYQHIIQEHGLSAPVLYNLANSYAQQGQVGFAVLYYERALQLAPADADIRANLEQVRKDAGLYRDNQAFYEQLALIFGPNQWLLVSLAAFILLSLIVLSAALRPKLPPHFHLCLILCIVLSILPLPPAFLGYHNWQQGVVIVEDARLLLSPFAESSSLGSIQAGRLVRPRQEHGDYVFVRDETGRSGWLHQRSFQPLLVK